MTGIFYRKFIFLFLTLIELKLYATNLTSNSEAANPYDVPASSFLYRVIQVPDSENISNANILSFVVNLGNLRRLEEFEDPSYLQNSNRHSNLVRTDDIYVRTFLNYRNTNSQLTFAVGPEGLLRRLENVRREILQSNSVGNTHRTTWIIQEFIPREINPEYTRNTRFETVRMWNNMEHILHRSINNATGLSREREDRQTPSLERRALVSYLINRIFFPGLYRDVTEEGTDHPVLTNRARAINALRQRRTFLGNFEPDSQLPIPHAARNNIRRTVRDRGTMLELALNRGLAQEYTYDTWLLTFPNVTHYFNFSDRLWGILGINSWQENVQFPQEFVRRTFIGRFNERGDFNLGLRDDSTQQATFLHRSFIGLNQTENYRTDNRLLAFLGLLQEEDPPLSPLPPIPPRRAPIVLGGNQTDEVNDIQRGRFKISRCVSPQREKRGITEHLITNEISNCQDNDSPIKTKGSIFNITMKNNPSVLLSGNVEIALTGEGLYKIVTNAPETNKSLCLTNTSEDLVIYTPCQNSEKNNYGKQKWEITKIVSENNFFEAKVTQDNGCLFIKNNKLTFDTSCNLKTAQAHTLLFKEMKENKEQRVLPVYIHSILNDFTSEEKDNTKGETFTETSWTVSLTNEGYHEYKLTNIENLKKYTNSFDVIKSNEIVPFNLTESGRTYTTAGGRERFPLCLTASSVDSGAWQSIGFMPCDKNLDKYQLWDFSFIGNNNSQLVNPNDHFIIESLKLKNSDTCLRMKNYSTNWGYLFLSKCKEYNDNKYLLKLKFIP